MIPSRLLLTVAALGASASTTFADGIAFDGPEVVKLDWNTRVLQPADMNGDGLVDLVVINNDRASVVILQQRKPGEAAPEIPGLSRSRWQPVLEDARFNKVTVTTGVAMFDLVVGDFDGDKRMDLAYTGEPAALTIRYQRENTWEEQVFTTAPAPLKFPSGLRAVDLNDDGRTDLVQIGQREIAFYLQDRDGRLALTEKIPLTEEGAFGLEAVDVDNNGRVDLVYLNPGPRDPLRLRRQDKDGRFGPEEAFTLKSAGSLLQPLSRPPEGAAGTWFTNVLAPTGQLEFVRLGADERDTTDLVPVPVPRIFAPRTGVRNAGIYVFGDFDGENGEDVAVADADAAQVHVYFRKADGGFSVARSFPSLSEVRSVASVAWSKKGPHSLVLASGKEAIFAELVQEKNGRMSPPRALAIAGRPIAVAGGAIDAKGTPGLVTLTEDGGKRTLAFWVREKGELKQVRSLELAGLRTDPRDLRLIDINQDNRPDVAVFVPREGVRVILQEADGTLVEATSKPAYRPGLLAKVEQPAVGVGDIDGDGKPELIVSSETFARALRMNADGELEIVAQFNAGDPGAEIAAAFVVPVKKGRPQIVLHDRKGEQFHILRADEAGDYRVADTRSVGRIEVGGGELRFGPKNRPELFLLGRDRFWWMPIGASDLAVVSDGSYASDLPRVRYNYAHVDDLDGDGSSEIVAVDTGENLVELLQRDDDGAWKSRLHFKVFEADPHYQGRRGAPQEPREAITADVTGDGKPDLVLLIHDRVLVYPQK